MTASTPNRTPAPPRPRSPRLLQRVSPALVAVAGLVLVGAVGPALRPPREPADITRALAQGPHAGDCEQCHTTHGADQPTVYPNALVGPNDNTLCLRCHASAWTTGSWAGDALYRATGHGTGFASIWPGPQPPARIDADAPGKCLNCHDPHGLSDADGLVPQLTLAREERLCLACHDGHPATSNVLADLQKPYRHPVTDFTGRHTGPGEAAPADFGTTPINRRHAECEDCHNPHASRADGLGRPRDSEASATTLGVSRVAVLNGPAGSPPVYSFLPASDTLTTPNDEYQLCFKCHSSWTSLPSGKTDLARALNPSNPSYHPVEATGRNTGIDPRSFVVGWGPNSFTRCGDCHGSDFGTVRGPHGSIYPAILRRAYVVSPLERPMASDELCFSCHAYEVYGDHNSVPAMQASSRFNEPATGLGHAGHVGKSNVPCYACHVTHGSTSLPFLLATGRNPGIRSYVQSPTGGTCDATCHEPETYQVNYAR